MNTASTDDIDLGAVWRSLRRAMSKLLLLSLVTGGATYALLEGVAKEEKAKLLGGNAVKLWGLKV